MTGLHDPIKPTDRSGRHPIFWVAALIVLCLFGYSIWSLIAQQKPETVVAINNPAQNDGTSNGKSEKVVIEVVDGNSGNNPTQPSQPRQPQSTEPKRPKAPEAPQFRPAAPTSNNVQRWRTPIDMVEASQYGPLPKISDGNVRPLDHYAEPVGTIGGARVSIVIGGLGISQTSTQAAIKDLPKGITLAFSPLGNSLQRWMEVARREGHETILQIPMEPLGYPAINPGIHTLVAGQGDENIDHLHWSLGRMKSYPVVMNYLGAGILSKPEDLAPILTEIRNRGLAWFDDGSAQISKSISLAEELRLPHVSGNLVLDGSRDPGRIRTQLSALKLIAQRRGYAVASATAFPETVKAVAEWAKNADKEGIQLVPLSNLVKDFSR